MIAHLVDENTKLIQELLKRPNKKLDEQMAPENSDSEASDHDQNILKLSTAISAAKSKLSELDNRTASLTQTLAESKIRAETLARACLSAGGV